MKKWISSSFPMIFLHAYSLFLIGHQLIHRFVQPRIRHKILFQVDIKRDRCVQAGATHHGSIEVLEAVFGNPGSYLGAGAPVSVSS